MHIFSYFLLLLYIIIIVFIIKKLKFYSSKTISKKSIILFAIFKMFAGVLYIYINKYHNNGGDIFEYFKDCNVIFNQLKESPIYYFRLVFLPNNVSIPYDLKPMIYEMGFWNDTGAYMMVRFNALIRLFSFGNFYIHGVFSGIFSFIGSFLIFKLFEQKLNANKIVLYSFFLTPTLLFWTSGIHKESISIFALGLILYHFFKLIDNHKNLKHLIFFSIGMILFFFTRNYMLLALIPSLLAYTIHKKLNISFRYSTTFSVLLIITFLNFAKIPSYNKTGFEVIIEKRQQFEDLKYGNTAIVLDEINPNFFSLIKNSPKALFNTTARPHFGEIKNKFLLFASIESFALVVLIFLAIISFPKLNLEEKNIVIFMLIYSISLLLIIGWIVPNVGAIIRYRSLALITLVPTLIFTTSKYYGKEN